MFAGTLQGQRECATSLERSEVVCQFAVCYSVATRESVSACVSAKNRWTRWTAMEPSPTAEATRFMLPDRLSPTAKRPGTLVSSNMGVREMGHRKRSRYSPSSAPVTMNPFLSKINPNFCKKEEVKDVRF